MKKRILLLALLAGFTLLCGCGGDDDMGSNDLSAKMKKRIVQDCADIWGCSGVTYYGAYNGWVVVRVVFPGPDVIRPNEGPFVIIGGFDISVNPPIIAWKDGQIHELKEAYDLGLLTQDDLISIVEPRPRENWWAVSNSKPSGDQPWILNTKLEKRIVQDCLGIGKWEVEGIEYYYGFYNGWILVKLKVPVTDVEQIVTIGGFDFNVLPPTIAWKDGQIHELKDAYDLGLLTQDDLRSIHVYTPKEVTK